MRIGIAFVLCLVIALPILTSGCSAGDPAAAAPPAVTVLPVQPSPSSIPEDGGGPIQTGSTIPATPESKSKTPTPTATPAKAGKAEEPSPVEGMFLWIEGMPGESADANHPNWIEVLRYDLRVGGPVAPYAIGNEGPAFSKFTIMKKVDKASPYLAKAVCEGTRIPEVVIELCRGSAGSKEVYMRYRLTDVVVTRVTDRASPQLMGGDTLPMEDISLFGGETLPMEDISLNSTPLPMEEVSFVYRTIEWTYFTVEGGQISAGWDLAGNEAL